MYCPRCRVQIPDDQCPQCGLKIKPVGEKTAREPSEPRPQPINFAFSTRKTIEERPTVSDWRTELRRKLSQRTEPAAAERQAAPAEKAQLPPEPAQVEIEKPLFQYKLGEVEADRRIVTFTKKPLPPSPPQKPVVRTPVSSRSSRRSTGPEPRQLSLDVPPRETAPPPPAPVEEAALRVEELSPEVLFSRLLAGIIDLLLPVLVGLFFTFTASWIVNFDFFSVISLRLGLAFSLSFYFFNSFYFLYTLQQTPGMYLTDLQLVDEESEEIPFGSICLRICLFLPVLATVVGLLWGFFDPWRRCLHDRLSQTRVVPVREPL